MRSTEKGRCRDVRYADEKAREKPVTAEVRRNAAFGGTQGWRRSCQVAMPGRASGDARLPSAGGEADFVGK
ncbi:hypothetical protein [Mesotoga sp. Brook.08.YT.4.2.5.1]|uniref:hypothetical protein n=1 Tax=Mesotoga sp. Brook.08.YT.4.2.5.1 TaxID=1421001 RepID=UPI0015E12E57|nr:hypothetical protein [Mesotoga sp. Brook.08.YT.4.2.5.1]